MPAGNLIGKSGFAAEVEQVSKSLRATLRPQEVIGSYCTEFITGTMAAGIAGGSTFFSFRWPPPAAVIIGNPLIATLALIRSVRLLVFSGTGFSAGIATFTMIPQRSFTVQDTGGVAGTIDAKTGKMRGSFPTSQADVYIATTAALTPGTRTADNAPCARLRVNFDATASAVELPSTRLFGPDSDLSYPLVLAQNEGFSLLCIVPGTGTWIAGVTIAWDEVASF